MVAKLLFSLALCALAHAQTVGVRLAGGVTRRVPMDEYIGWVLSGEAGGMKAPQALQAMAVVARTYARANLGRHRAQGFDFCETTHCQDARAGAIPARIRAAVEATEGIILWDRGRPAKVFYTGHCGGRSAGAGEIWPGAARTYLPSREDPYCLQSSPGRWNTLIPWADLAALLTLPTLEHLEIARLTASGRVAELRSNAGPISAERLHLLAGRALGWNRLRSRFYEIVETPQGPRFEGRGTGHGVGFCQIGAEQRALAGHTWQQIVQAYLPGLRAGVAAKDIPWRVVQSERLELWITGAPADEDLPRLADTALAEAEKRTTLRAGKRPQLRAYPEVSSFRDATGEPGTIAAITRGRIVHLQPAARLRANGTLHSTLLHEMIHVLIALNTAVPVPIWFDEGLAGYLAGGTTHSNERARVAAMVRKQGLPAVLNLLKTGVR